MADKLDAALPLSVRNASDFPSPLTNLSLRLCLISGGAATDGDPRLIASQLRDIRTRDGNLLFFNVDYVKGRIEEIIESLAPGTEWFIFDGSATAQIDSTAVVMLDDVHTFTEEKGLKFGFVELHREPLETLVRSGVAAKIGSDMIFEDIEDAAAAFTAARGERSS